MNWDQANQLISAKITKGLRLNSSYRVIVEVPPYACNGHDYNGAEGFRVKIGKTTHIQIPIVMLQNVFNDAVVNKKIYNKGIFRIHYPRVAEEKTGHPCHIHVVGRIFELAGVAEKIDDRNYRIL